MIWIYALWVGGVLLCLAVIGAGLIENAGRPPEPKERVRRRSDSASTDSGYVWSPTADNYGHGGHDSGCSDGGHGGDGGGCY